MTWLLAIGKAVLWVIKTAWAYPLIAGAVAAVTLATAAALQRQESWISQLFGDTLDTIGVVLATVCTVRMVYDWFKGPWLTQENIVGGGYPISVIRDYVYGPPVM